MVDFEKINIKDINPAEYNPRKISNSEYEKLSNSINEFGVVDPIIINLNNNKIIGGHQRYDVLFNEYTTNNKYSELNLLRLGDIGWVFPTTDLKLDSEQHEKALNIALNKISGEWDNEKLNDLFTDLSIDGFDLTLTGFDSLELTELKLEDDMFSWEDVTEDIDSHTDDLEKESEDKKTVEVITCPHCNQEIILD